MTFFSLYSFALPVMGKEEALIINLHDSGVTKIPMFLCEALLDFSNLSITEWEKIYNDNNNSIRQYLDKLQQKILGTYTDNIGEFPKLEMTWDVPSTISSSVIEVNDASNPMFKEMLKELEILGCKHLEVWYLGKVNGLDNLIKTLSELGETIIRSIDLMLPFECYSDIETIIAYKKQAIKLSEIIVYAAPYQRKNINHQIFFLKSNLQNPRLKKKNIPDDEYIICLDFFLESQKHNPYYNKKVCIDKYGYVRNCLSHKKHFGRVQDLKLSEIVIRDDFQELWFACNDKVVDIQDSPYRYIWMNTYDLLKAEGNLYKMVKSYE